MKFCKLKSRAFTLLECLVALLVISGSVLVIHGLTRLINQEYRLMQNQEARNWQLFCSQLRSELDNSSFVKVEDNFLYVKKTDDWRLGVVGADFRKAHANGLGYQPMLFDLKGGKITASGSTVKITIQPSKGGERVFFYKFQESK